MKADKIKPTFPAHRIITEQPFPLSTTELVVLVIIAISLVILIF